MRLKRVSFSLIGMSWPWQSAHPAGAKLPPNILISPTYGFAIDTPLVTRRENSLERNNEIEDQIRLPVLMRLRTSKIRDRQRCERGVWIGAIRVLRIVGGKIVPRRVDVSSVGEVAGIQEMIMRRQFAQGKSMNLLP